MRWLLLALMLLALGSLGRGLLVGGGSERAAGGPADSGRRGFAAPSALALQAPEARPAERVQPRRVASPPAVAGRASANGTAVGDLERLRVFCTEQGGRRYLGPARLELFELGATLPWATVGTEDADAVFEELPPGRIWRLVVTLPQGTSFEQTSRAQAPGAEEAPCEVRVRVDEVTVACRLLDELGAPVAGRDVAILARGPGFTMEVHARTDALGFLEWSGSSAAEVAGHLDVFEVEDAAGERGWRLAWPGLGDGGRVELGDLRPAERESP